MAKSEDKLSRWLVIVAVIFILAAVIWKLVPKDIIYASIGIGVAIVAGVSYLVYRKRGLQPFKGFGRKLFKAMISPEQKGKRPRTPIPSEIKRAVYRRADNCCQHPNCGRTENPIIHHIDGDRTNHNLNNLILLCREHAAKADHGNYHIEQLKNWMTQPGVPRYHSRTYWRRH